MAALEESCCGLGCNNCLLDRLQISDRPSFGQIFNLFTAKGYQKFRVKNISKEREHIYLFTFELIRERPEPWKSDEQLVAPPISYLMLRAPRDFKENNKKFNPMFEDFKEFLEAPRDADEGRYYRSQPQRYDKGTPEIFFSRKFTPWEVNEEARTFKILVRLEKFGLMSNYLTRLNVGSVCEIKGPFEAFHYKHEEIENYICITQGISIVSVFRLVKEIIYESAQSRVLVIACFKNINETFLRHDFFMLTHYWNLKHHVYFSEKVEPDVKPRSGERYHFERLTGENFKELMKELKFFDPERTQVLLSGRERFIEFAKEIVTQNRYKNVATI